MAVSAKFLADFTDFKRAVDQAELKLTGLRSESGRVEKQLQRMGDSFSGKKIFADAELASKAVEGLGGVSKLTAIEQQRLNGIVTEAISKYKAMGLEAPKHLTDVAKATTPVHTGMSSILSTLKSIGPAIGVAFSVGSIVSFGKSIADFSGKMLDLEAQTQITTKRLQAFDFVGGDVDLTIEEITTSADQLAKRLGGDDKSVNEALEKLNLSGADLKQLNLDDVMFEIDEALVGVTNQMDRARILTDLFGRSGAQLGRLMDGSLREVIKKAEETGPIIDRELLQKADRFGEMWEHGWKRFQAAAVTGIDFVLQALDKLMEASAEVGRAMREDRSSGEFGGPTAGPNVTGRTGPRRFAPRNITVDSIAPDIIRGSGIGTLLRSKEETKALTDAMKAADDEAKKYRDHLNEVGIRMMEADAATAAFFKQMGTGIEFMRRTQPSALFGNQIPTSLAMFGPRDISKGAQGGAGVGLGPGSLFRGLSIGKSFSGFADALPDVILGALQGGGDITKSIGSLLGGSLLGSGTGLNKALTGGISSLLGKTIGGFASAILPGIGALVGPAITGIGKLFGGLFGGEGKKTNRLRDESISGFTGITGDKGASQAAFRDMAAAAGIASAEIDKLFSTKRTKDFESAMESISNRIKTFSTEQEADAERLANAIEKYGIAFEDAGAAFQKQKLDEQAKELIEDWRVLVGSGIDLGLVNDKMSEAINEYLQTAIRVGQEVPNAMRPILEKMLQQGTLTDEAGNAITDMEAAGIHFAETMTEGFDRVVQKLDELITKLGMAGSALGDLSVPSIPSSFMDSSGLTAADAIPMASGGRGRVNKPTLFLAGESGSEDFAFSGAGRRFSSPEVVSAIQGLDSRLASFMRVMPIALRDAVLLAR